MDAPPWVADPAIGWRILLSARLRSPAQPARLNTALARLYDDQGWPAAPRPWAVADADEARRRLVLADPHPLLLAHAAGASSGELVISAHHGLVDGLGLLEVLDRCGVGPVRSSARGLAADVAQRGLATGVARRLSEALLRPPRVPANRTRGRASGDVMVERTISGTLRTADLVHAGAQAVPAWQRAHGAPADRVAIAVGASRGRRSPGAPLADDSLLIRLRGAEDLDRDAIAAALRTAVPEASPHTASNAPAGSILAGTLSLGMRVLAPRLGSTLLVSHLGEITAPGVGGLAFHPVTAGGSGISLGAVGHGGRTTLTLRARAARWNGDGLEQLLEAIVHRL